MITRSLVGNAKHVWSEDPALDTDSPAYDAVQFIETGDIKHMPARPGETLAIFEIAPLSRKQWQRLSALESSDEKYNEAVAYGLKSVSGYTIGGLPVEVKKQTYQGEERLTAPTLDALFEPVLFRELGGRILLLSRLSPSKR